MTKNPRPAGKTAAAAKKSATRKVAPARNAPEPASKPASKPAAKPSAKAAPANKAKVAQPSAAAPKSAAEKAKKVKLVRDSFTMPEPEYALIAQVKKVCVGAGFEIKKSELLRIGVALLAQMDPKKLRAAQQALMPLKAGRPKKK